MDQYFVVSSDGREYGPVDLAGLVEWLRQGRVLRTTLVRKGQAEPAVAETLAELAPYFAPPAVASPPIGIAVTLPGEFKSWQFVGLAWDLVKPHWLPLAFIFFLVNAISSVPYIGACVFLIIGGAIYVGVNRVILGVVAGRPPDIGGMFTGFDRFGQAFLAMLTMFGLTILGMAPFVAPALIAVARGSRGSWTLAELIIGGIAMAMVIGIFVSVLWVFVYLVLAETDLTFWEAMKASVRLTAGYRWQVFCFLLACLVVGVAGLLVCLVGFFIAQPVIYTATALVYRFLQARQAEPSA